METVSSTSKSGESEYAMTDSPAADNSNGAEVPVRKSGDENTDTKSDLFSLTDTQLVSVNEQVNKTRLMSQFFGRFQLFNWEHFPVVVLVACLVLSCVIIMTVVMVARRIETESGGGGRQIRKSVVEVGGGGFLPSKYASKLNQSDDEDDDENDSSTRLMMYEKYCTCVSSGLKRNSFDSCEDFYDEGKFISFKCVAG
jgi:hypothetical protein